MQRKSWLSGAISFCKDTPDHKKGHPPVFLDITRDGKRWLVEVDYIHRASPSSGAWAEIDGYAELSCGDLSRNIRPFRAAGRGSWCIYEFTSAIAAQRFAERVWVFTAQMHAKGLGLVEQGQKDPLGQLAEEAVSAQCRQELETRLGDNTFVEA